MRQKIPLIPALGYAATAQVVSSCSNLALGALLLIVQTKIEFGLYGVCFAASLLIGGTAAALVTPVSVKYSQIAERRRNVFAHDVSSLAFVVAVLIIALSILVAPFASLLNVSAAEALTIGTGGAAYFLRDSLFRVAHTTHQERTVLLATCISSAVVAVTLTLSVLLLPEIHGVTAMFCYATGQLGGAIAAYSLLYGAHRLRLSRAQQTARLLWPLSRWNLLASFAYNFRAQAHALIAAPILGLGAVALINAGRMFVQPAMLALPVLSQVLLPRITPANFGYRRLGFTAAGASLVIGLYAALISLLAGSLGRGVLQHYENVSVVLLPWCIVLCVVTWRTCVYLYLEIRGLYKQIFLANFCTAVIIVPTTFVLARSYGVIGAVLAAASAEAALLVLLLPMLRPRTTSRA